VSNGFEARHRLSQRTFDAIITDYKMPGKMSGADLYRWVCENLPGQEKHIIFMTGNAVENSTYEFLESIDRPVILKPFNFREIKAALKQVMVQHAGASGPAPVDEFSEARDRLRERRR